MNLSDIQLVLASASPRRSEILSNMGFSFDIRTSNAEDQLPDSSQQSHSGPADTVEALSLLKASDIARQLIAQPCYEKPVLVIGADTVVSIDDEILGKPRDRSHAKEMIESLAGHTHQVYTGVSLIYLPFPLPVTNLSALSSRQIRTFHQCSRVDVYPMTSQEINHYLDSSEPYDKAGAYGIQGLFSSYIRGIHGDYFNIVGLPAGSTYHELEAILAENQFPA